MMVLLGDEVTVQREVGSDYTFVTGRVTGVVLKDSGELKYFYLKGIDSAFYMSDGWKFQEEFEEGEDDEDA
jgi:hypothetical protein